MIDIETLGTKPGSVIASIGAVEFSDKGLGRQYYGRIDIRSAQEAGLTIDAGTVGWWLGQSEEARRELLDTKHNLGGILSEFSVFVHESKAEGIWGNGATFDNVLLRTAYEIAGVKCPWHYTLDRCYRTLKGLRPDIPLAKRTGTYHNALHDAITQADHAVQILTRL